MILFPNRKGDFRKYNINRRNIRHQKSLYFFGKEEFVPEPKILKKIGRKQVL